MEHEIMRPLSESQREWLAEATATYEAALSHDRAAVSHLTARGIDKQTAATYRLGVVSEPFPGHERMVGKLAIPYIGHDGRILTIRFRCVQQHNCRDFGHGKYMSMTDDPPRIYNVRAIHQAGDEIHIAEGEFDAIILNKIGLYATAVPGAHLWKPYHRRMFAGFSRVWTWGDPDEAGADLNNRIARSLRQAKAVRLPGMDVTDVYLERGAEGVLSLLSAGRGRKAA